MDKLKHARLPEAFKVAGDSDASALRLAALAISTRLSPGATAPVLASLVTRGGVEEQKTALRSLGFSRHATAAPLLVEQMKKLAAGSIAPAVQLDLLNAAGCRSELEIKKNSSPIATPRSRRTPTRSHPIAPRSRAAMPGAARAFSRISPSWPASAATASAARVAAKPARTSPASARSKRAKTSSNPS
jgi:hypothetical protein